LYSSVTQTFLPDATIQGSFAGRDGNGDGTVDASELTSFIVAALDYTKCASETDPYSSCSLGRFSYALTGKLDFSAGWSAHDEFFSWYGGVTSGAGNFYHRSGPVGEEDDNLLWTDATTFSISPAPVPEPAGAAMALAGIAMLGAARRRNRGILQGR
jgi:MYXO-CTERM domain-containing protein